MNINDYKAACEEAFEIVRNSITPKRTGNLAYNALGYRWEGNTFHMWVDEAIAPYMVYTNEVWTSPRWRGRKNPNEGWWQEACEFVAHWISHRLHGEEKFLHSSAKGEST